MTDSSGVLGDWRAVLAGGLAVLVGSVVTLVVRTGDPATADSFLSQVRAAAVALPDGSLVTAHDGMRVPDGSTVRTGAGGGAVIDTAGRAVYLGSLSTVRILDGVRQELQRGQVMVDTRNGSGLGLTTRAGLADVSDDALVRVETGPVLRLGVFDGQTSLTAAGRQARRDVPTLYQLQAPYGGVAGSPTALALTDDPWEQRLAPDLVNADRDLNALASGLKGGSGTTVLQAAPVSLRTVQFTSSDPGERALTVALAQASRHSRPLEETFGFVQRARVDGGSWGVVASLVQARVTSVSALLDAVLAPPGTTPPPPVVAGSPQPLFPGLLTPSPTDSRPGRPSPRPSSSTPVRHSPSPRPSHSPSASPSTPADDLLTTLTKLLSPSPSLLNLKGLSH